MNGDPNPATGVVSAAPFLRLERLTKRFRGVAAVDGLSLSVPRGDILALLGPSGSGKTTTLRLLAGFETPDEGRIVVDGEEITGAAPSARRFGMVFQHYALFPHLDVGRNIAFGLESRGLASEERERRVTDALTMVELAGLERRPVSALSGGQQQRVALARALAPAPRVLLLDEPLSNLDPGLRERTRRELRRLIERIGITTILVTHEQEEAFDLADHVAVLQGGRLQQVATPQELYREPATAFVVGFIGRASAVPVRVLAHDETTAEVMLPGAPAPWKISRALSLEGDVVLHVRPEAVRLAPPREDLLTGILAERRFLGASSLYTVRLADGSTLEVSEPAADRELGSRVGIVPGDQGLHLFPVGRS